LAKESMDSQFLSKILTKMMKSEYTCQRETKIYTWELDEL
jgi:hypothetical protein